MRRTLRVETLDTASEVARRGAEIVAEAAARAITQRGRFQLALSGGSTPWQMVRELAAGPLPWAEVTVYQVDERVAPDGDPSRNLTQLLEALGPAAGTTHVVPMDVTEPDLDAAAADYASLLPPRLDVVHLGLGNDGHTASLVPGDPVLDETERNVAPTGVYRGQRRLTLTYPALAEARLALWLVTGADKRDAVELLRRQSETIPAGRVLTTSQVLLLDGAADGS